MSRAGEETNLKLWPLWSPQRPCPGFVRIFINGSPWSSLEHAQRREKESRGECNMKCIAISCDYALDAVSLELRFSGHWELALCKRWAELAASEGGDEPSIWIQNSNLHLIVAQKRYSWAKCLGKHAAGLLRIVWQQFRFRQQAPINWNW